MIANARKTFYTHAFRQKEWKGLGISNWGVFFFFKKKRAGGRMGLNCVRSAF